MFKPMRTTLTITFLLALPILVAAQETKLPNYKAVSVATGVYDTVAQSVHWNEELKSDIPVTINLDTKTIRIFNNREDTYVMISFKKEMDQEDYTIWEIGAYDQYETQVEITDFLPRTGGLFRCLMISHPEYNIRYVLKPI